MTEPSSVLSMSRSRYLSTHGSFDKLVIGAAIIRRGAGKEILLLKRSADEEYYPNVFEMPGGNVDATDASIREAVLREVREETGLEVEAFLSRLPDFTYATEKKVRNAAGRDEVVRKNAVQLSWVVSVKEGQVEINPEEHSESVWASRRDVEGLEMTEDMQKLVCAALDAE